MDTLFNLNYTFFADKFSWLVGHFPKRYIYMYIYEVRFVPVFFHKSA